MNAPCETFSIVFSPSPAVFCKWLCTQSVCTWRTLMASKNFLFVHGTIIHNIYDIMARSFHAHGCVCRCYVSTTSRTTHQVLAIEWKQRNFHPSKVSHCMYQFVHCHCILYLDIITDTCSYIIGVRTYVYLASNSRYTGACLRDASMTSRRLSCNLL